MLHEKDVWGSIAATHKSAIAGFFLIFFSAVAAKKLGIQRKMKNESLVS